MTGFATEMRIEGGIFFSAVLFFLVQGGEPRSGLPAQNRNQKSSPNPPIVRALPTSEWHNPRIPDTQAYK